MKFFEAMRIKREPAPEVIRVPVDEAGRIACDLLCAHCLYNLRGMETGQSVCPECGLPAAESEDQYRRYWVDESWVGDELAARFVYVGIILSFQFGSLLALAMVLIWILTFGVPVRVEAMRAWAMVVATVVMGLLAFRRYLLRSPISFGNGAQSGGVARVLPCLVHLALLVPVLVGIYGSIPGLGKNGWLFNWLLIGGGMCVLTWEQWVSARGLIDVQGRLSSKPVGVWVWLMFVPSPILVAGWVWMWVMLIGVPNHASDLELSLRVGFLIAGSAVAFIPVVCLMAMAIWKDKWVRAALWTRTRARKAGEMPQGFGAQEARFFWMQRFGAWFFERKRASGAKKSHGEK